MFLYNNFRLPTPEEIAEWKLGVSGVVDKVKEGAMPLSKEDRSSFRKMGPHGLVYAITANRLGAQHIEHLPRSFNPVDFDNLLKAHADLSIVHSYVKQLDELLSDYIMALGIEAMVKTKVVHDALRTANYNIPELNAGLSELDEFNKRSSSDTFENSTINTEE